MIDAVVTWVDGEDPMHVRKRSEFLKSDRSCPVELKGSELTRFRERNELYYSVHLLRKNAPWISRIFLITDAQRPNWLDDATQTRLNLHIIDHTTVFCGFERFLPTFNSLSIETVMHRIPELSERFLYLNDDFFIINKTTKEDYFAHDQCLYRGEWRTSSAFKRFVMKTRLRKIFKHFYNDRHAYGFISRRGESRMLPDFKNRFFLLAHAPYPMCKTSISASLAQSGAIEENIKHRFRTSGQFWTVALAAHHGFSSGTSGTGAMDWEYINCYSDDLRIIEERLLRCSTDTNIKSICVQSLDLASDAAATQVVDFLEKTLGRL